MKTKNIFFLASVSVLLAWLFHDSAVLAQYIYQYRNPSFKNLFLRERADPFLHSFLWRNSFYVHAAVGTLILFSGGTAWAY